ncbi:MAG: hypothetical protein U1F58_12630 [Burkholderiales bacterium]
MSAPSLLRRLHALRAAYGGDAASRKLDVLARLARHPFASARMLTEWHEALCWLRAYPDDARVLRRVEAILRGFEVRRDVRRHADALANSGIAGTAIRDRFFSPVAQWLAQTWPGRLRMDWEAFEHTDELENLLPLLATYSESTGLDDLELSPREWIDLMRGRESDGAFLARRLHALPMDAFAREKIYDRLDPTLTLAWGRAGPSRTHARAAGLPVSFQAGPLRTQRPRLPAAILDPPRAILPVDRRRGRALIDLAREAMVTRSRDLDAFSYGDPADVRLIDCGDGLVFACIGVLPERRLMLETVYAFLTLKNGVPIGYVLVSGLFGSSEVAYNVFETFRGGEAGYVYGRVLAATRALLGTDAFTVFPYQLGDGNDEALESGAWWFYQKLGFRPRDRALLALMRRELARMRARPGHRSSMATLRRLAADNVYYFMHAPRDDVMGILPTGEIGLAVTRYIARRFGSDRTAAGTACAADAAALCGVRSLNGWTRGERLWFERWSPLILALPGVAQWSRAERQALAAVARAKGGRRESDYAARLDAHPRLRATLVRMATR